MTARTITCWHASPHRLSELAPFSHVGSRRAAEARAWTLRTGCFLHEVELQIENTIEIGDAVGAQHPVRGLLERLETELGLDFNLVDELLMQARSDEKSGIPPSLAGGDAVAKVLIGMGYDSLSYENRIEDPGSESWVILDPDRTRILSVSASGNGLRDDDTDTRMTRIP